MSRITATRAPGGGDNVFILPLRDGAPVDPAASRALGGAAIEVEVTPPAGPGIVGSLGVGAVETNASPTGDGDWQPIDLGPTLGAWTFSRTSFGTVAVPMSVDPARPGRVVIGADDPVTGLGATTIAFRPGAFDGLAQAPMAAILDDRALAATLTTVGDTVPARHGFSETWNLAVTGVVSSVPGVTGTGAVIVDLGTLQAMAYGSDGTVPPADEWWLTTDGRDDPAIARAVAAAPFGLTDVRSRRMETAARLDDPVALALFGTLRLAAVAALVFAGVGLAASAWAAGRARRGEFAVVRALGLRRRELATWLVTEQAFPIALGVGGGVLLGIVLGVVVLPVTTRAPNGATPVPPALVGVPWDLVGLIVLAGTIAVIGTTGLVLRGIQSVGVAATLRGTGEEGEG
jgi:hypothetical protein